MELWMWTIALALAIGGGMWGYALGTNNNPDNAEERGKNKILETELHSLKKEFGGYRDEVNDHFKKTADLVHELTSSYKAVYEQLASGSEKLCSGQVMIDVKEAQRLEADINQPSTSASSVH
jgi:hypothetical protein